MAAADRKREHESNIQTDSEEEYECERQPEWRDWDEVEGYQFEPDIAVGEGSDDEDVVVDVHTRDQIIREYANLEWCECRNCQPMPTREQNKCCKKHPRAKLVAQNLKCIVEHEWVDQLLQEGPLHIEYARFLHNHDEIFPENPSEEDRRKKLRFCAYRSMVMWLYPNLKKRQRRPLPACLYEYIHKKFPPTDDLDDVNDWRFSEYSER